MLVEVKQSLSRLTLAADEEHRIAALLKLLLLVIVAGVGGYTIFFPFVVLTPSLHAWLVGTIFLFVAVTFQILRKGQLRLAAGLLVGWVWLFTTLFILTDPDDVISFNPYIICIFLTGLLLGERCGLYCAGLSIVSSLSILWASAHGILPLDPLAHAPLVAGIAQLVACGIAAALLHFIAQNLTTALARAERNEQTLQEVNQALRARNAEIERHVATLQASEARAQALIQALPDTLLCVHRRGLYRCAKTQAAITFDELLQGTTSQKIENYFPLAFASQLLQAGLTANHAIVDNFFEYERTVNGERRIYEARIGYVNAEEMLVLERDITARKQAEEQKSELLAALNAQSTRLRALYHRLAETQETERKRLAQELHDQVGQNLTALDLNLNFVCTCLPADLPQHERMRASLIDSLALTQQTNALVRDVLTDLRPSVLDNYGLCIALQWYATVLAKRTGILIRIACEANALRVSEAMELALFRIAQEAFTNIIKHAAATEAAVTLTVDAATVRLVISDNGCGFDGELWPKTTGSSSWGLLTMQERAEAVGGHCRIKSQAGHGTHVIVEVNR